MITNCFIPFVQGACLNYAIMMAIAALPVHMYKLRIYHSYAFLNKFDHYKV